MAKRKKTDGSSPAKDLLTRIRKRYTVMVEADRENRQRGLEDLKFVNVPGEQWDANMKKERGDRPCYEFNKLRVTAKRIINDMRANRPAGKIRAVEDGDKKTAEVYEGLVRNIWNTSDGDTIIDYEAEYQVNAGMAAWRINTQYAEEDAFDQDIVIEAIQNPFCLYADPAAKDPLKRDAQDWILTERMSKSAYEMRWPKAQKVSWEETEFDDEDEWEDEETVRICEYWYKEPYEKELWQLADGKVIDGGSDEAAAIRAHMEAGALPPDTIRRTRMAVCNRIKMCIASGDAILEESDWAGAQFPFVMIFGEYVIIDGKLYWFGLPRFAKDAQRSYNVSRTAITETIAQAPQAKWWATVDQAKGHTEKWAEAHQKNFPFLLYNSDPKVGTAPQRIGGADVPVALIQESQIASEEIKAVTGIFDASLGKQGNETSGRAITARQQQGEIATVNYQDNMAKGIRRTWEILIDLIPKVYDTEREIRVLGSDGAEDYVKVNQIVQDPVSGNAIKVHDLATGRYDVTVTVGPSWATKRMEASEMYMQLAQANPAVMAVAADLMVKAMDLPYSEDIAERLKVMLPPPIQQMLQQGKEIPPEAQAVMAQAAQAMQLVEQQMMQVQQAAQQIQQEQAGVEKGKAEIQTLIANLKTQEAQFNAHVAQQLAKITQQQAQLQVQQANAQAEGVKAEASVQKADDSVNIQVVQAISTINQMAQAFMSSATEVLAAIHEQTAQPQKPRIARVESIREGGKLVAVPVYEDAPVQ